MHRHSEYFLQCHSIPVEKATATCNSHYLIYTVMPPEVQWNNLNPKLRLPRAKGRAGRSEPGKDEQMDRSVLNTL